MPDPTQRHVDHQLSDSMDLFERADVGPTTEVPQRRPQKILIAPDGTTQDHALTLFAKQLRDRLSCEVGCLTAFGGSPASPDQTVELGATAVAADASLEEDYDQVLAAAQSFGADLLMLPCPFRRDFEALGEDSTGTVMEVVTARSEIPTIFLRRPDAIGRDPSDHVRIVLTRENAAAEKTASWAVGLVQPHGRLELLLMVEKSTYENFREIMNSLQPDAEFHPEDLESALARTYAPLHSGLQKASREQGFTYELIIRYEADEQPITPEHPQTHPALIALGLVRHDHDSRNEIHDFVRRSPHPVLVVPVD
ncbi:hypothetical protein Pla123a_09610 [Posidoniimonas polymericola]|uniref:Universal stress protein family protein n=1 Tax=Posidoniimonas polymericola TaxID=2528002 RepID=A0A5C5YTN8_9BACT|nr:hypothetical protein [Posidoniimonas polymericola]TWT78171.1 hypothetical protein Pla123a_09610 [Posidoniimonas polymericola]